MKKNIFLKIGGIIMALGMMLSFGSCLEINKPTANRVCKYLNDTYNREFEATHIGGRLNSDDATLYISPKDDPSLVFTAFIDREGNITDNYVTALKCREVENALNRCIEQRSLTGISEVYILENVTENNPDISIGDFMKKHGIESFHVRFIFVPSDGYGQKIVDSLTDTADLLSINIGSLVFAMSQENYEACKTEIEDYPNVTLAMIESHEPIGAYNVIVSDGVISASAVEIEENIGA